MSFGKKGRERVRNADKARNSFVTRRAETKVSALADLFKAAAGDRWERTRLDTLQRKLFFTGFRYLDFLKLAYNWENRFMSVNYNLQMISDIPTDSDRFEETGDCSFVLECRQKGLKGQRDYSWVCRQWSASDEKLDEYMKRLANPLITERFQALDIMEMEIRYRKEWEYWHISCESIIGSATWILIPPVLSMITPKLEECVKFLEMFELLGDALVNNKTAGGTESADNEIACGETIQE